MTRKRKITKSEREESPGDLGPKISTSKKILFSAVICLSFFALLELGLWLAGVPTLIEQEDPFRGFSGLVKVFQREGPIYRTQPATRGVTFNDQSFLAEKPAHALRIFCLGGSSSFGFPWGAEFAFTSIAGDALTATHPERKVEAVNASGVSYAMHRMNIVADEVLAYQPDVFLVYEGHNEFIEPAFFEALKHRNTYRSRLEYALSYSRVYSGMAWVAKRMQASPNVSPGGFETRVMRDQSRVYSPEEKEAIVAEFRWRLERLVRRAQAAGVKVVLATVPCNLRQWRPEASTGVTNLAERDRQQRSDLFASGSRLLKNGRFDLAVADLEQAARIAPHHAETYFLLGQTYVGLGRFDDARAAYQRACDEDASPIRRLSGMNVAIREIARQSGALLVDVDRFFEQQSEHGLVGFNLIEDYVHPTQHGHELIAWQIWEAMEKAGWFSDKSLAQQAVFDRVLAQRKPKAPENNAVWFYNQGVVLSKQGQVDQAIKSYRQAVALSPNYSSALLNLGKSLAENGQSTEGVTFLQDALRIRPNYADAHNELGSALIKLGRMDEAITHFQEALRIRSDFADAHFNLGSALDNCGKVDEAMAHYQKTLEINPNHAEAHNNLGLDLFKRGRSDEAIAHYRHALEIKPDYAEPHINLGLDLARRGKVDESMAHY
ncbi:MAG: tetratricopeptide repeat protein, partial [Verrucomicrobiaceae bacterium]